MALVLTEPFDNLTAWTNTSGFTIVAGGRTGNAVQQTSSGQNLIYAIASGNQTDSVTVGFAVKVADLSATRQICQLRSGSPSATLQQRLDIVSSSGSPALGLTINNPGGSSPASAAGLMVADTWAYLELQVKLADSPNGSIIVRVNGTTVISSTGIDTMTGVSATPKFDQLRLITSGTTTHQWDDLYLRNDLTFQGDPNPPGPGGKLNVWNGSAFVKSTAVKVWNGSAFVDATAAKVWNGSSFVDVV